MKKSGMGRTHSHFGLIDFVNIKHISIDAAGPWHRLWWYPYGASRVDLVRGGIELLHGAFPLGKLNGLIRFLYNSIAKPKPPTKDSS